jgi:hypothetical protein
MKVVGYLEGTDPVLLTKLICRGIDTIPISNGYDTHGRYILHITNRDVSLVIGYLHKVVPPRGTAIKVSDILYSCTLHQIPVILLVPEEEKDNAMEVIREIEEKVTIVDPKDAFDTVIKILGS